MSKQLETKLHCNSLLIERAHVGPKSLSVCFRFVVALFLRRAKNLAKSDDYITKSVNIAYFNRGIGYHNDVDVDRKICMETVGHGLCHTLLLIDLGNGRRGGYLPSLLLNLFWTCNQQPCLCVTLV